jgi:hypothetical protein
MDKYRWYGLLPVEVNPEFYSAVLSEVQKGASLSRSGCLCLDSSWMDPRPPVGQRQRRDRASLGQKRRFALRAPTLCSLRPRPNVGYADAGAKATQGIRKPPAPVFRRLLGEFLGRYERLETIFEFNPSESRLGWNAVTAEIANSLFGFNLIPTFTFSFRTDASPQVMSNECIAYIDL